MCVHVLTGIMTVNSEFVTLGDRYSGLIGEPQVLVVHLLSFNLSVQLLEINKIKIMLPHF